jgi:hypothetical protein
MALIERLHPDVVETYRNSLLKSPNLRSHENLARPRDNSIMRQLGGPTSGQRLVMKLPGTRK